MKVFEAFAGFGGASFGLKKAKIDYELVGYSEITRSAINIFELNHPNTKNYGDISTINPHTLPDFDLFTGGFPCQSYSSAGKGLGVEDLRGLLIYDVIKICEVKKPQHILLENVKGLLSKRHKDTFDMIINSLEELGYYSHYELLNTKDYGIPQNRERVWMYFSTSKIPVGFKLAPIKKSHRSLEHFLEKNPPQNLYKTLEQIKKGKQLGRLMDLYESDFQKDEFYFGDLYNKSIKKISPTLTEVHHNTIRVIEPMVGKNYKVRKLSVREYYKLMGFDDSFDILLGSESYSSCCNRAANGWDVSLAAQIFSNILKPRVF